MLLLYLKLLIKSYIELAHDSGFSITDISKYLLSVFYKNYLDLCPGVKLDDSIPAIAQISS